LRGKTKAEKAKTSSRKGAKRKISSIGLRGVRMSKGKRKSADWKQGSLPSTPYMLRKSADK